MFDDTSGRMARTIQQAEDYIFCFLSDNECMCKESAQAAQRSHDYDLYLPWLLEVVENQHLENDSSAPKVADLDHLYMDAAWSLTQQGFLRPGPTRITGDSGGQGYGKGFTLTQKGRDRLNQRGSSGKPLI